MKTSLIISTYNNPRYLELCLKSALLQTVPPDEIIIADDGSTQETADLIRRIAETSKTPIVHVWHEDNGFKLCQIRNKAFARCSGDYIIQSDGDIIFERHFVQDHIRLAERGYFVCGSRVHLSQKYTQKLFDKKKIHPHLWRMKLGYMLNAIRIKPLQKILALRYGKKIDKLRGCNMAFWKDDIIKVNGYNEDLTSWGHEDGELAFRLHFAGIKKKFLKSGGICYHLYHKESSRENEATHLNAIRQVLANKDTWCKNGIDKYL